MALGSLLANVTAGSVQSGFLGPDPHFVLSIVALNLVSLRHSACHSINSVSALLTSVNSPSLSGYSNQEGGYSGEAHSSAGLE